MLWNTPSTFNVERFVTTAQQGAGYLSLSQFAGKLESNSTVVLGAVTFINHKDVRHKYSLPISSTIKKQAFYTAVI